MIPLLLLSTASQANLTGYEIVTQQTAQAGGTNKELTVTCPSGKRVLGAGWGVVHDSGGDYNGDILHSMPSADGTAWTVKAFSWATTWRLRVSVTCANLSSLSGYQVLSFTASSAYSSPNPVCPTTQLAVGVGWTATNSSSSEVGSTVWANLRQPDSLFGDQWYLFLDAEGDTSRLGQARIICVDRTALTSFQTASFQSAEDTADEKQVYAECPAGKRVLGVGYNSPRNLGCPSCGDWKSRQLFALPSLDGRKWLVRHSDVGGYVGTSAWRVNLQLFCAETDAPPPSTCGVTPETMTFTSAGPSTWPAACWRPFDTVTNPFVRPIPWSAKAHQLHTNSANIVAQLLAGGRPGEFVGQRDGKVGEPTYYSQASDPEYTIRCKNDPFDDPDGHCAAIEGRTVRVPAWALPEGGVASNAQQDGTDSHITIIDRAAGFEYDLWQVQTAPLPTSPQPDNSIPDLVVSAGNRIALSSNGLYAEGTQTSTSSGVGRNGTAGYFANLQGKVRLEELEAGEINHALFMLVRCHNTFEGSSGVVYPAAGGGGRKCTGLFSGDNTHAPAMGAHFFYDRTPADIDALRRANNTPLPAWKRAVLKALSRYGAFVGDTAGGWGFDQESSYQYSSVTNGARRWFDYGASQGWSYWHGPDGLPNTDDDRHFGRLYDTSGGSADDIADAAIIDFATHLKVLKPCVSQGTCS